jgi:hypothetical protein
MEKLHVPWGYLAGHDGKLVATTGQAQIRHRALLGETAIRVLSALGIGLEQVEEMVDIDDPEQLLAKLRERVT